MIWLLLIADLKSNCGVQIALEQLFHAFIVFVGVFGSADAESAVDDLAPLEGARNPGPKVHGKDKTLFTKGC